MSRTYKDRPRKVREREAMKAGRIYHDHLPHPAMERTSRYPSRALSREIPKGDTGALRAYREELASNPQVGRVEETELKPRAYIDFKPEGAYRVTVVPRMVSFQVYTTFTAAEYSDYCSDYEHYDFAKGVDTRDGKRARCVPDTFYSYSYGYYCSCSYCRRGYPRGERARVRDELRALLKDANGSGLEDGEYSGVEEVYESRGWC